MCWWHMNKNTKTQLAFVRSADPGIYSSIVSDLKDEFYDLELKENVMKFLSNVKTSWIDDARVSKWFQAANPHAPSTNNALESR